jgi:pyruvate/2-oxoglutarate dehydrogenase complex dihydrolipoamide acyltransferase (E2) component
MSKILNWVFRHYVKIAFAAAMFVSAGAHAGPSRGLSLATAEAPPQSEPSQPATNTPQATPTATAPVATPETKTPATPQPTVAMKPAGKHVNTEARVIYELHRHGIYS